MFNVAISLDQRSTATSTYIAYIFVNLLIVLIVEIDSNHNFHFYTVDFSNSQHSYACYLYNPLWFMNPFPSLCLIGNKRYHFWFMHKPQSSAVQTKRHKLQLFLDCRFQVNIEPCWGKWRIQSKPTHQRHKSFMSVWIWVSRAVEKHTKLVVKMRYQQQFSQVTLHHGLSHLDSWIQLLIVSSTLALLIV